MSNQIFEDNRDYRIPGKWEKFLERFQEKFWKKLITTSQPVKKEDNKLISKVEIWVQNII